MDQIFCGYYDSPIGLIEIAGVDQAITALRFVEARQESFLSTAVIEMALAQLAEYFSAPRHPAGPRRRFDLPLDLHGTPFQQRVWRQLLEIPYGQTASYADIARALGDPKLVRAVGVANSKNPVAIIVPCHRVIGSDGSLTGYGGGLWRKEWLLKHEGCMLA